MARWQLLALIVAASAAAVGCAHCDVCDDFPVPCSGANCGGGPGVPVAPVVAVPEAPVLMAPGTPSAPVISSQPGPFAQPAASSTGTNPAGSNSLPGSDSPPAPKQ